VQIEKIKAYYCLETWILVESQCRLGTNNLKTPRHIPTVLLGTKRRNFDWHS